MNEENKLPEPDTFERVDLPPNDDWISRGRHHRMLFDIRIRELKETPNPSYSCEVCDAPTSRQKPLCLEHILDMDYVRNMEQ